MPDGPYDWPPGPPLTADLVLPERLGGSDNAAIAVGQTDGGVLRILRFGPGGELFVVAAPAAAGVSQTFILAAAAPVPDLGPPPVIPLVVDFTTGATTQGVQSYTMIQNGADPIQVSYDAGVTWVTATTVPGDRFSDDRRFSPVTTISVQSLGAVGTTSAFLIVGEEVL